MEYLFLNARSLQLQPKATVSFISFFNNRRYKLYKSIPQLPFHVFSDVSAYRIKSINKLQPTWYIPIHPSHYYYHFTVNLLHPIQIPTDRFISKNALLCSISFVLLFRSPGRSSPSFQLLVMNPFFFMRVREDTIISFTIKFFASVLFTQYIIQYFLDIKNHCIDTSNRNYTIQ